jgi:hypothetical protein
VFDAQVAQQRLQAGITTLVSSREVTTATIFFIKAGREEFAKVLNCSSFSGRDRDIFQEGRPHGGGQPLGVAPHRAGDARPDQRQGRAHHLPRQGRRRRRLPLARHQPLPQM